MKQVISNNKVDYHVRGEFDPSFDVKQAQNYTRSARGQRWSYTNGKACHLTLVFAILQFGLLFVLQTVLFLMKFFRMQLRKTDIDVIKGAQQTDQLDGLKANALGIKSGWYRHKKLTAILVASVVVLGGFLVFGPQHDC